MLLNKPAIGVDLDDTVVEFVAGFMEYHNRFYGTALARHQFTNWDWHHVLGCTEEEAKRRGIEFYHSAHHLKMNAVPGAQHALRLFQKKYTNIGITAREPIRAPRMRIVVRRLFGDSFTRIHFLGTQKPKGDLCARLGVRFMVDDGLHNAQSVGEKGIRVYLMDRPWNQCEALPPNTIRVFHWDDIVRLEG